MAGLSKVPAAKCGAEKPNRKGKAQDILGDLPGSLPATAEVLHARYLSLGKAHREDFLPSLGSFPCWPVRLGFVGVGSWELISLLSFCCCPKTTRHLKRHLCNIARFFGYKQFSHGFSKQFFRLSQYLCEAVASAWPS
jgi:hypothetical protein